MQITVSRNVVHDGVNIDFIGKPGDDKQPISHLFLRVALGPKATMKLGKTLVKIANSLIKGEKK